MTFPEALRMNHVSRQGYIDSNAHSEDIFQLIKDGRIDEFQQAVSRSTKLSDKNADKLTPLAAAVESGNLEMVSILLEYENSIGINEKCGDEGRTALGIAVHLGKYLIAEALLKSEIIDACILDDSDGCALFDVIDLEKTPGKAYSRHVNDFDHDERVAVAIINHKNTNLGATISGGYCFILHMIEMRPPLSVIHAYFNNEKANFFFMRGGMVNSALCAFIRMEMDINSIKILLDIRDRPMGLNSGGENGGGALVEIFEKLDNYEAYEPYLANFDILEEVLKREDLYLELNSDEYSAARNIFGFGFTCMDHLKPMIQSTQAKKFPIG